MALITEKIDLDNIFQYMQWIKADTGNLLSYISKPFDVTFGFSRQANTTQYAINKLIIDTSTTLYALDLTTCGGHANQEISIQNVELLSDNTANTLNARIYFFNTNNISGVSLGDNLIFNPNPVQFPDFYTFVESLSQIVGSATSIYHKEEVNRIVRADSNGLIYYAIVTNAVYTPKSGELLQINVKGTLLN